MNKILLVFAWALCVFYTADAQYASRTRSKTVVSHKNNNLRFATGFSQGSTYELRNGQLFAYGLNANGQLGIGNTATPRMTPALTVYDSNWTHVAAGYFHALGIRTDGSLWAWGYPNYGQVGAGDNLQQKSPVRIGTDNDWIAVSAGYYHSYAIKADGSLWGWGLNGDYELGLGHTTMQVKVPTRVGSDNKWVCVSAGQYHSIGLKSDGTLWGWGYNNNGQVGNGGNNNQPTPIQIGSESDWVICAAGGNHSFALKADGRLYAWGTNGSGELGIGSLSNQTVPVQIPGIWMTITATSYNGFAIKADGTLWGWGLDHQGQLGNGGAGAVTAPVQLGSDDDWTTVYATAVYTNMASKADGSIWAWGNKEYSQFGLNSNTPAINPSPLQIASPGSVLTWASMDAGGGHMLAVKSDGTLWSWGKNSRGELGDNSLTNQHTAVRIGSAANWTGVSAGNNHSLGLRADGSVYSWGNNSNGQLGYSGGNQQSPSRVGADNDWTSIAAGNAFSVALKANGTLWSWGKNDKGQLGTGTNTDRNSLVQLSGTTWASVVAGGAHNLALKADGTLWSWGDNAAGQLGIGNNTDQNTPQQIGTDRNWVSIAAGDDYSLALKSDGTIWAWGGNGNGQLGQGNNTAHNQPVQIPTAQNWISIIAGASHAFAIKADGLVYGWGGNGNGQLGLGNTTDQLVPVVVPGIPDAIALAAGNGFSARIDVQRRMICMTGANAEGQLGVGSASDLSSFTCPGACIPPTATITPDGPTTVCAGGTVKLDANTGSGLTYQWYRDAQPVSNATDPSYTATASGSYTVQVTEGSCSKTSAATAVSIDNPTITLSGTVPFVCAGVTTASVAYTATTGNPTTYSIDWNNFAVGFVDVVNQPFSGGSLSVPIPAGAQPGTYYGAITVSNGSCSSGGGPLQSISVEVKAAPSVPAIGGDDSVCVGGSINLTNTEPGGTWAANPGTVAVVNTTGTVTGINPGSVTISYTVENRSTGCSTVVTLPVYVKPLPTISLGAVPEICAGAATASQIYTATGNPDRYSIQWDGTATGQGFKVAIDSLLTASPVSIPASTTAIPGTYSGFLFVSAAGCMSNLTPLSVRVITAPTITLGTNPSVCEGIAAANLPYSAITGSPTQYSISWDNDAQGAGFQDVANATLPLNSFNIPIPSGTSPGTYKGKLTVRNADCSSIPADFTVTVKTIAAITPGTIDAVCAGTTSVPLPYTNPVGNPDRYDIVWTSAPGFSNVTDATLPANTINIPVPGTATAGVYTGTLTVRNSDTNCVSASYPVSITVKTTAGITPGTIPAVCFGATAVALPYTTPVGNPDRYSIVWTSAPGFSDVTDAPLAVNSINISIPGTALPGTYTGTLTVRNSDTNCVSSTYPVSVKIKTIAGITPGAIAAVCAGATTASLPYTAPVGNPDRYSIVWTSAPGFSDVTDASLAANSISISIPGTALPGTYTGTLTVRNSDTNCVSSSYPVSVQVKTVAGITPGAIAAVCAGPTNVSLPYTTPVGNPDRYSIVWTSAPGFSDVTDAALPANSINISVPGAAAPGTYTGMLTVRNSDTNCVSISYPLSVRIKTVAGITPGTNPAVCFGAASASLVYTAPVGNPDRYSIVWASAPGFSDVTDAALPANSINISVPGAAAPGTYTGTLTVRNSDTNCVSTSYPISVSVKTVAGITPGTIAAVCAGTTTASLPYTIPVGNPNRYSIVWTSAPGFANVTDAVLPANTISISVPGSAAAGTYTGTLTVRNSDTNCVSTSYPVSVRVKTVAGITPGTIAAVCAGTTTASLPYTTPVGNPNRYSIVWTSAPGFTNVTDAVLPANTISISVPGSAVAGTYTGTLTVRNSDTNCVSTSYPVSVKVKTVAGITPGTIAAICAGATTASLPYTSPVGNPNRYSIVWTSAPGFSNVTDAVLPANTISISVSGTAAPGTYTGTLTVRNNDTNCVSTSYPVSVRVKTVAGITPGTIAAVCAGTTNVSLPYTTPVGNPNRYSIVWTSAPGFSNVTDAVLPANTINISVPGTAAPGTYTGTLTVRNSDTNCVSVSYPISVRIKTVASVTPGSNPSICAGAPSVTLPYSGAAGNPNQYSIIWQSAATSAGFTDVTNASLPASPLNIAIPVSAPPAAYSGVLTVRNADTGCVSMDIPITVTTTTQTSVALGVTPEVCSGVTIASHVYTGAVGSPDQYSITWNTAATTAGFINITNASLPSGAIALSVPAAAAPATYSGTLTVRNSAAGCLSASQTISVTVLPLPTITLGATPEACTGDDSTWLAYTGTTVSPDQYSIAWNGAAQSAGFVNVSNAVLPAAGIGVLLPPGLPADTYSGNLTVSNSTCQSLSVPFSIMVHETPSATITASGPTDICKGDSVTLDGTSPLASASYEWWNGSVSTSATGSTYTADTTGAYTVVVTNFHCKDTATAVPVILYAPPVISIDQTDTAFCAGGWVMLNAVSPDTGLSYRWKDGNADIPMAQASFYEVTATGSYTVVASRNHVNSCRDSSAAVEVTVYPLPQPSLNRNGDRFFTDGGYVQYQWLRNTQAIPGATDSFHKASMPGAYAVSVTDSNGCTAISPTYNLNQLGVTPAVASWDVQIYPNPSAGVVKIASPVSVNVTVNSIDGKLLLQRTDVQEIDLGVFADGVYLLRVYTPEGMLLKNERVVKSRW